MRKKHGCCLRKKAGRNTASEEETVLQKTWENLLPLTLLHGENKQLASARCGAKRLPAWKKSSTGAPETETAASAQEATPALQKKKHHVSWHHRHAAEEETPPASASRRRHAVKLALLASLRKLWRSQQSILKPEEIEENYQWNLEIYFEMVAVIEKATMQLFMLAVMTLLISVYRNTMPESLSRRKYMAREILQITAISSVV